MSRSIATPLEPRKTPLQARSTVTVQAIMEATIQVLLKDGRSKLTTTRIAERAGVSVGTLYQYFPNKTSLLKAILKEHLDHVALAMEVACAAAQGRPLATMAEAITFAFVQAKFRSIDISSALYAISDDVEGKQIARTMHARATKAMSALFQTASEKDIQNPDTVAATLLNAMAGVSRATLEMGVVHGTMATMQKELATMTRAYLEASTEKNF